MADKQLTIILTLKDRSLYTYRWMAYQNEQRCPHPILLADGGADKKVEAHLKNRANYPHLDYEYIRYPEDVSFQHYYDKLADVSSKVRTPYATLTDNDDFHFAARMTEAARFLDAHPDYVSCGGPSVSFFVDKADTSNIDNLVSGGGFVARRTEQHLPLESPSPRERVLHLFRNYYSVTWYNVIRSEAMVEVFKASAKARLDRLLLQELLVIAGVHALGKVTQSLSPHVIRQELTSNSSNDTGIERGNYFQSAMLPFWSDNIGRMVGFLVEQVCARERLDREAFDLELRLTMGEYLQASSSGIRRKSGPKFLRRLKEKNALPVRLARSAASLFKHATSSRMTTLRQGSQPLLDEYPDLKGVAEFLARYRPERP